MLDWSFLDYLLPCNWLLQDQNTGCVAKGVFLGKLAVSVLRVFRLLNPPHTSTRSCVIRLHVRDRHGEGGIGVFSSQFLSSLIIEIDAVVHFLS